MGGAIAKISSPIAPEARKKAASLVGLIGGSEALAWYFGRDKENQVS